MTPKKLAILAALAAAAVAIAQQSDIVATIVRQDRVSIAVPDFRGRDGALKFMDTFNQTLYGDLESSGQFRMVPKTMFPLEVPQRPQDFVTPAAAAAPPQRKGGPTPQTTRRGPWLTDWSDPPVSATYLAFGYSAEQDGRLMVFGYLYNVTQPDLTNAQVLGKIYLGSLDEQGARQTAREFASDILKQLGLKGLFGTKIYYESQVGDVREIWSMDPDGANQKQLTFHKSLVMGKSLSPDGTMMAYAVQLKGQQWVLQMMSLETGGRLSFFNAPGTLNWTPDFTPDGKRIVFGSNTAKEGNQEIYVAGTDGRGMDRLTFNGRVNAEPKVNPKTGNEIVFMSDRGGMPQIYKMNMSGADVQRLTDGEGEAVNPVWHPSGQTFAFAWTRGFAPGNYNIFVMDAATRKYDQLTHGAGLNENPAWAPDGVHLAFSSTREGGQQIWTMLADGTQLKKLTTRGRNLRPVWK
jgi:TolB protein